MLVAADVLLGEGGPVVPTQNRVADFALIQHGLQLALVAAVDVSPEQMGGSIGAANEYAPVRRPAGIML